MEDYRGGYGLWAFLFFFLGALIIASHFLLMALGVYATSPKLW